MHDVTSFGGVVLVWGLVGTAALLARRVARWIGIPAPAVFLIAAAVAANSIKALRTAVDLHVVENVVTVGPDRHPFRRRTASGTTAVPRGRGADRRPRRARDLRHDGTDRGRLTHHLRSRLEILRRPRGRVGTDRSRGRLRGPCEQGTDRADGGDPRGRVGIQRPGRHCTAAWVRATRHAMHTGPLPSCSETSRSRWRWDVPSASLAAWRCDGCSALGVRPLEIQQPLLALAGILALYGAATVAHGSGFLAVLIAGIVIERCHQP